MSAQERLELSRARLRVAMLPVPRVTQRLSDATTPRWLARLKALPGIGLVADTVQGWWSRHPLRSVTEVAAQASSTLVGPFAQRRPLALVLAAAVAGAALAWGRPRRWLFRSALFAGLVPQLAARIVSRLPVETWLKHPPAVKSTAYERSRYQPAL